jgi:type II secretory pathway pseudopilin PulG
MTRRSKAFSLVEVALALGVIAFVLIGVTGLLVAGVNSNKTSVEEIRATHILTLVESDLLNSIPGADGLSLLFSLPSPYAPDSTGTRLISRQSLVPGKLYTVQLGENERPVSAAETGRFRVSVIFTHIPPAESLAPVEARLIVNWPPLQNPTEATIIDRTQASYVETRVAFPIP